MNIFKKDKEIIKEKDESNFIDNIQKGLYDNISKVRTSLGNSGDIVIKYLKLDYEEKMYAAIIYLDTLVDRQYMDALSLQLAEISIKDNGFLKNKNPEERFNAIISYFSAFKPSEEGTKYEMVFNYLLSGGTVFFIDGYDRFFSIQTFTNEGRSIEEPTSQSIIRGPKDGFTERINTNIFLIRKRIKSENVRLERMQIGSETKTSVALMYIDKIAKSEIVNEIRDRLEKIQIDSILESHYIEEMIKDNRYSVFPTFLNSEKPDSVAGAILEGKVAILVDNTPYVLTAPALFVDFIQTSEDYYHNFITTSVVRILRAVSFFLTLLVPATYIALITYHQEMIPTPLLISIAAQREGIPFPALFEALIMELTFEILREAGVRMPRVVGPAISIVGALVLGQAAVEAGLISAAMVIVVAITAISSFAIPNYEMANSVRLIRFVLMFFAGFLGLYGVFMGLIILTLHLCHLKSIGIPYLTPISPRIENGNKDTFLRYPLWSMKYRPVGISSTNEPRVDSSPIVTEEYKGKQEM